MRLRDVALSTCLLGACIPVEPEWLITGARFRGVRVEVVEPGGYGSLLNVPPGEHRATILPLDTVELEWHVAVPPGDELQPPIWIACGSNCFGGTDYYGAIQSLEAVLADCPHPLPLARGESCRLGEGPRIRVGLGSAFSIDPELGPLVLVLVVGSRRADLTPTTCLERLTASPIPPAESCLFAAWWVRFGPEWAALPFGPEQSAVPPEIREQEVDTNPEIVAFAVTRERGDSRIKLVAGVGDEVPVRRGERVTVEPLFAEGSAQSYWILVGGENGVPWSGTPSEQHERLEWRGWFSAPVEAFAPEPSHEWDSDLQWVVPHDVVPTTLYVDARDNRSGVAFAELQFVADGSDR